MGKSAWSCSKHEKISFHRGAWTASEDRILSEYIKTHGAGGWGSLPKKAGLTRCGKSCRLRWLNYLRPDIKRGSISPEEDDLLIRLHRLLGNRWALIAGRLPGRTDNEIKNYWNTHLSKRVQLGEIQPKCWKPLNRNWDVPSYSNYDEEGVVHKDISTSQNTAVKPTAVRYCGKAAADVDILDCINQEGLKAVDKDVDILDCINQDGLKAVDIFYCINQEGLKAVDNDVLEINTSKSWCQLLLEDSTGHYEHDRFQPNSMISTSCRADEHHQFPSPSLGGSIILQENQSSSSNIFDPEFPHPKDFNSSYFDSFLDLGELSILLP